VLKSKNLVPRSRLLAINSVIIFVFTILFFRFFHIQIYGYNKYKKRADINRIRVIPTAAPRGMILDRYGQILVDNYPTYILTGLPNEMGNENWSFSVISNCTAIDTAILIDNFDRYFRGRFIPSRIIKDLTFDQLSCIEEHKHELAGINYIQFSERSFPSDVNMSHVLGYVKEIDRSLLNNMGDTEQYDVGDLIGAQGLEKQYENLLRGEKGLSFLQVDAFGREVGKVKDINDIKPIPRVKKIARPHLVKSWTEIPHVTQHDEVDITEMEQFRNSLRDIHTGKIVKTTPLSFIIRALVKALIDFPIFNSSLDIANEKMKKLNGQRLNK